MIFSRNSKIKKASIYTVNFNLPALKTCPYAGKCKRYCFGMKGCYKAFAYVVEPAQERNFDHSRDRFFIADCVNELENRRKVEAVRWHDCGDFYSWHYMLRVLSIARRTPDINHYAYTKSIPFVRRAQQRDLVPENMAFILSEGGTRDRMINRKVDRYARIFHDGIPGDFVNATADDSQAWLNPNNKIGVEFH